MYIYIYIPWEPKTFIFRGYNPSIGGLKPSLFMVLGSKGIDINTYQCTACIYIYIIYKCRESLPSLALLNIPHYTPPKTNMETKHEGLEDDFSFHFLFKGMSFRFHLSFRGSIPWIFWRHHLFAKFGITLTLQPLSLRSASPFGTVPSLVTKKTEGTSTSYRCMYLYP